MTMQTRQLPHLQLNPEQHAAVHAPLGPVLVRAGAGSGKTQVLTLRIAHLITSQGIAPSSILAVTFTNKAANELRGRLRASLGNRTRGLVAATFHSVGLRMLRQSIAGRLRPYTQDFGIFGSQEQLHLAAEAQASYVGRPPVLWEADQLLARISRLKSRLLTPQLAARAAQGDSQAAYLAAVYRTYQRKLEAQNAIDFDDCILLAYRLLIEHADVHAEYSARWQHVLVDEYQDTDRAQYALLELLTRREDRTPRSLFVVGDSQQAIYGFRNADHTIIRQFGRDFPDATIVELETNYRSRQEILDAAYAVIRHATAVDALLLRAHAQHSWDFKALGIDQAASAREEADRIAKQIAELVQSGREPREVTILFRTGFMSRELERGLRQAHVPYIVRGNGGFYERAVVRDALAYLRTIANPADRLSLARIANKPARGISPATLDHVVARGAELGLNAGDALLDARCRATLKPQAAAAVRSFAVLLTGWRSRARSTYPPAHLLVDVLRDSGYRRWIETNQSERPVVPSEEAPEWRQQGLFAEEPLPVSAPVSGPRKAGRQGKEIDDLELLDELERAADEHTSLSEFLQEVALMTALQEEDQERNAVQLLTIHAAKGLEWPIVFVAGLEEGTLPHERSLAEKEGVEEERRLCYVALTRAKERLLLSWSKERQRGKYSVRSRFLDEIEAYGRELSRGVRG